MRKLKTIAAFCVLLIATVLLSACGGSAGSAGRNLDGLWHFSDGVGSIKMVEFSGDTFRQLGMFPRHPGGSAAGTFAITEDTINFERTLEIHPHGTVLLPPNSSFERVDEDTILINAGRFTRVTDSERIAYFEERWNNAVGE